VAANEKSSLRSLQSTSTIASSKLCENNPRRGSRARSTSMIKKVEGGYKVLSEKGKNLGGPYKSKKEAEKRLKQVEFFKHKKG
jgi:hypothetical protein